MWRQNIVRKYADETHVYVTLNAKSPQCGQAKWSLTNQGIYVFIYDLKKEYYNEIVVKIYCFAQTLTYCLLNYI